MFFDGLYEGWETFKKTVLFAFKNPILLFPMLLAVFGVVATIYYGVTEYNLLDQEWYIVILVYVVVVTFIISVCSLVLLELLEQKEQGRRMNILKAVFDALIFDLWRTLPVIIVWSVLKFFLTALEIFILIAKAKAKEKRKERGRSFRSFKERRLSRSKNFIEVLQTGVRMASMTILTSIAWEPLNPFKAFKKGLNVYKTHIGSVVMGVGLSNLLKMIMFIPSFLILYLVEKNTGEVPTEVALGVMIYFGFVWAISLMVEQIYVAELYIWYIGFEKEKQSASERNEEVPKTMLDVKRPSLFDDFADFQEEYERNRPERY